MGGFFRGEKRVNLQWGPHGQREISAPKQGSSMWDFLPARVDHRALVELGVLCGVRHSIDFSFILGH